MMTSLQAIMFADESGRRHLCNAIVLLRRHDKCLISIHIAKMRIRYEWKIQEEDQDSALGSTPDR